MRLFLPLSLRLFSICALLLVVPPAAAEWTICNKTGYPVVLAVGYKKGNQWISEGWWHISGGHCDHVVGGDLRQRYYYYYAEHEEIGGQWGGNAWFCVSHNSFTIVGDENCNKRGYEQKGFRKVDTGDSKSWTTSLTDK
jgi:uncharacterized membrane protein